MTTETPAKAVPLPERMLARANRDKLPEDHELRVLAKELNRLIEMTAGAALLVSARTGGGEEFTATQRYLGYGAALACAFLASDSMRWICSSV